MKMVFVITLCVVSILTSQGHSQDRLVAQRVGRHVTLVKGDSVSLARLLIEISDSSNPGWPTTSSGRAE